MSLELHTVRKLQFQGSGKKWELKSADTVMCGADEFVKLRRGTVAIGFSRLVFEGCPEFSGGDPPPGFSLTASKGYARILAIRNAAQSEEMRASESDKVPEMFRATCAKRVRLYTNENRARGTTNRVGQMVITVDDETGPFEITVLRPIHPCDDISIMLDTAMIDRVIRYIQREGFNEPKKLEKLPRGVWHAPNSKYTAMITKDGKKVKKTFATIDDAIGAIADGDDAIGAISDGDGARDDAEDDEGAGEE